MIKRELAKDPTLKNENWDRFLPKFKKKNPPQRKKKEKKKEYTPFPPPQQPRKMDLEMESGEYFLTEAQKNFRKKEAKKEKQSEKQKEKQREKEKNFIPPKV